MKFLNKLLQNFIINKLKGGIKRIALVAIGLGPIMIMLYIGMCIYLICVNGNNLLNALSIIFQVIFNKSAIGGEEGKLRPGVA